MEWQWTVARRRLDDVVSRALSEGPQRISRRGEVVVVLSEADFDRLRGNRVSLIDYLLQGPDLTGVDLSRDQSPMRGNTARC